MENEAKKVAEEEISDAEVVEEKVTREETKDDPSKHPYILIRRVNPNQTDTTETEGLQLRLPDDGMLDPAMVEAMIAEMYLSKLPDNRSITVTARLRNNFLIHESYAALTKDTVDEKIAIDICQARIKQKIWDYLTFVWSCASSRQSQVVQEIEERQRLYTVPEASPENT